MNFKDLFSEQSRDYAQFRPKYPARLFKYLAEHSKYHDLAWDCGTGNGQAAVELAKIFKKVIATDPSENQIKHAKQNSRVEYHVCSAEQSVLKTHSTDLITAAQALHWFEQDAFFKEVARVSKPGGWLAIWCYVLSYITPKVDQIVRHFYDDVVGKYWEPERRMVEDGYKDLHVPFKEVKTPNFEMNLEWSCDDLIGYLNTWSATRAAIKALGRNPLEDLAPELTAAWGRDEKKTVRWPVILRLAQIS